MPASMKHSKHSIVAIASILNDIHKYRGKKMCLNVMIDVFWQANLHGKLQGTGNNYGLVTQILYNKIIFKRMVLEAENKINQVTSICSFQHMRVIETPCYTSVQYLLIS